MDTASGFVIENNVLKKYVGPGADVVIPEGVAHIGAHTFQDNTDLISVSVPDSVLSICGGAFACRQRLNILHSVFSQDFAPALAFYDRKKKIKPKDFEKEWNLRRMPEPCSAKHGSWIGAAGISLAMLPLR